MSIKDVQAHMHDVVQVRNSEVEAYDEPNEVLAAQRAHWCIQYGLPRAFLSLAASLAASILAYEGLSETVCCACSAALMSDTCLRI